MAWEAELTPGALEQLLGLLDQRDKLEHMAQCQRSIIPKDAARRISDLAEALTKE